MSLVIRKLFGLKSNRNSARLRYKIIKAQRKLTACPITVAKAAPNTSISQDTTNTTSRIAFRTEAIAINKNGCLESPCRAEWRWPCCPRRETRSASQILPFFSRIGREKTGHQMKTDVRFFIWQGRRDSNTQHTVLETVALPLNYSPMFPRR